LCKGLEFGSDDVRVVLNPLEVGAELVKMILDEWCKIVKGFTTFKYCSELLMSSFDTSFKDGFSTDRGLLEAWKGKSFGKRNGVPS
jgi:hypothetical protein